MRTAPVALAYLDDEEALVEATRAVSELTHYDPEAGDACVLWCLAIRHAILTGLLDARIGLHHIDIDRRDLWASRLEVAEASQPSDFTNNGWVVEALQAAWSAITTTPIPEDNPATGVFRVDHLRLALDAAVRGGNDTDTVAAIAGGLLGAAYGASAVPADWRRVLHGWPEMRTRDLIALVTRIVEADKPFSYDIDSLAPVRHPHDDGVWLGNVTTLRTPSAWSTPNWTALSVTSGDPKDDEPREVPVPRFVMAELKKHISNRGPDDLIFGDGMNYLPRPKSTDGWFVGAVKRATVQKITPHDLRHAAASLAISAGANVLAVSRMLGHENPQVTLRTYADLFDTDLDQVSDALDTARRKSVSNRGPKRVQRLRKVTG